MPEVQDQTNGPELGSEEIAWIGTHMADLRRGLAGRRFRNGTLWVSLGIGLVVHVAGYLMKSAVTSEPAAVLADLLYTLGFALWTGVVVVAIVEIIPEAKERQIRRYLDTYEAALRSRTK